MVEPQASGRFYRGSIGWGDATGTVQIPENA